MSGKRKARSKRVPGGGHPAIASPNKQQGAFIRALFLGAPRNAQRKLNTLFNELLPYEKQLALVYAWFFKMLEVVESEGEKAAKEARVALETLFLNTVRRLLRLALDKKESDAKQWAGMLLGSVARSIAKYDEEKGKHAKELSKTNAAYVAAKAKIGKFRADVLFPAPIGKAIQQELRTAEGYQNKLLLLHAVFRRDRAGGEDSWKRIAKRLCIPEEYFGTMNLPEFWEKSEPQWWKFLWPLLKKNNPDLLEKLRGDAKRNEVVWTHSDGSSKRQVKSRKLFWKDFQPQFRNHLKALARQRVQ